MERRVAIGWAAEQIADWQARKVSAYSAMTALLGGEGPLSGKGWGPVSWEQVAGLLVDTLERHEAGQPLGPQQVVETTWRI